MGCQGVNQPSDIFDDGVNLFRLTQPRSSKRHILLQDTLSNRRTAYMGKWSQTRKT